MTIEYQGWWPASLRPLAEQYGPHRVRRIGEKVLGYPPDVFGVTFDDLRKLTSALETTGKDD